MVDHPSSPCAPQHPGIAAQQCPSAKKPSWKRASNLLVEKSNCEQGGKVDGRSSIAYVLHVKRLEFVINCF